MIAFFSLLYPATLKSAGDYVIPSVKKLRSSVRPSVHPSVCLSVCPSVRQRLLAHLSQRLIGELIGYSWSGVRRRPSLTISNFFFSETAWPIKAKFYVEPPWVGGTKVCSRHLGHMTKMAATPIYGKNPSKIFFSRTGRPIFTKLGM